MLDVRGHEVEGLLQLGNNRLEVVVDIGGKLFLRQAHVETIMFAAGRLHTGRLIDCMAHAGAGDIDGLSDLVDLAHRLVVG